MIVKNVSPGQPITAAWANSLVNTVNQKNGILVPHSRIDNTKAKGGALFSDSEAWKVNVANDGKIILNAGQVFINGLLVKPENAQTSHNNLCSASNWKDVFLQEWTEDKPIFVLNIEMPFVCNESNISDVKCEIKIESAGAQNDNDQEGETDEENQTRKVKIQLNDIVTEGEKKKIVQLVSGTIFLNYNTVSFIAGDNIHLIQKVDEETKQETLLIHNKLSFVEGDGISIEETEEVETTEEESYPKKIIEICNKHSFVAGDGISIEETEEEKEVTNASGEKVTRKFQTFKMSSTPLSFIGVDGITIEEGEEGIADESNPGTTKKVKTVTIGGGGGNYSFVGKDGITILEQEFSETREDGTTKNVQQISIFDKAISLIAHDPLTLKITKEKGKADYPPNPEWEAWTLQPLNISLIQGDGIKVTQQRDESNFAIHYKVEAKDFSFLCNDNLEIISSGDAGEFVEWSAKAKSVKLQSSGAISMEKSVEKTDKTWNDIYKLSVPHVSIIAGDNVIVEKIEQDGAHYYKVSATGGMSEIEFDPIYFTVTDGTVSLNTSALDEIISEAVNEISVNVTAEGIIEHAATGNAEYKTEANNLSLKTTVYNVY